MEQKLNPKLSELVIAFSGILNTNRRVTDEVRNIHKQMRVAILRTEADMVEANNEGALAELKKAKKEIKGTEIEIGLRRK